MNNILNQFFGCTLLTSLIEGQVDVGLDDVSWCDITCLKIIQLDSKKKTYFAQLKSKEK